MILSARFISLRLALFGEAIANPIWQLSVNFLRHHNMQDFEKNGPTRMEKEQKCETQVVVEASIIP